MSKEKGFAEGMMRTRKNQAESFLSIPNRDNTPAAKPEPVTESETSASAVKESPQVNQEPAESRFNVTKVKHDLPTGAEYGYYTVSGVYHNQAERKSKSVNFIMRPSTLELLRKRAKLQGLSCNELIHVLIETYCVD